MTLQLASPRTTRIVCRGPGFAGVVGAVLFFCQPCGGRRLRRLPFGEPHVDRRWLPRIPSARTLGGYSGVPLRMSAPSSTGVVRPVGPPGRKTGLLNIARAERPAHCAARCEPQPCSATPSFGAGIVYLTTGTMICSRLGRIAIVGVRDVSTRVALQARSAVATCDFGRLLAAQGSDLLAARTRILWTGERSMSGGNGQALVIPALSLSMTWLIVKLAGRCDGGNSINDWAIWAT